MVLGLMGDPKSTWCQHPFRKWQDIVKVDGYPIGEFLDVTTQRWPECPRRWNHSFQRTVFRVADQLYIISYKPEHPTYKHYASLSSAHEHLRYPSMLDQEDGDEGEWIGEPWDGFPVTNIIIA
jgi:hypothetical protein